MTELLSGVEAPSDAELISRVRGGDVAAYGELFARHVEAARRLGRQLVRGTDVDDLVSDAFAKTLRVLQGGGGPDVAFRAYLLTCMRRLHVDKIRAAKKVQPADDMTLYDPGVPFRDTAVASFENGAAAKAFSSLPERWQLVLWHLEVEGQKPADIAPLLGMSANSVSALAYRAREGLRQAFLTMHLADSPTEQCRWVNEHLGGYVRKGLSRRDTAKVEEHLDGCRRCTAMYLDLKDVNSNLAGIIAPLLLGVAGAGYASSADSAGLTGVSAAVGRVRDVLGANAGGGAVAGAGSAVTTGGLMTAGGLLAAGVAAVTTAAFVLGGGADKEVLVEADTPIGIVQTPPSGDAAGDVGDDTIDEAAGESADAELLAEPAEETAPDEPAPALAAGDAEPVGTTDTPPASPTAPDESAPHAPGADGPTGPAVQGPAVQGPAAPDPDPGVDPDSDPVTDPGSDPVTDPGSDPDSGPVTDPGSDQGSIADPGTSPGVVEPVPEPAPEPVPGSQPDAQPITDPGAEPASDPDVVDGIPETAPEPPAPSSFRFAEQPTAILNDEGQQKHLVRVQFVGVHDQEQITLTLEDSQASFCEEDDCPPQSTTRAVLVSLTEGGTVFEYTFYAKLPGKSPVKLSATLETTISEMINRD
jgi:RNA polymerase sigma factor (sigma-70 family)